MSCKTCLRYGHTVKRCHETVATCARCSCQGHNKDKCTSTESGAATVEKTTKHSRGTAQYSKEKWKSSGSQQKNA